jgi:hypothetical protein
MVRGYRWWQRLAAGLVGGVGMAYLYWQWAGYAR